MGDVVAVDPEGMRALAAVMDGVADELGDIGAEVASALSSVGEASWATAEVAMVAAWLEVEAHDVRVRAANVEAERAWRQMPIGAPLLVFDHDAFGWGGHGRFRARPRRGRRGMRSATISRTRTWWGRCATLPACPWRRTPRSSST
ncbi:MAG: hypothetical protein CYG61_02700 [Actinobacteria bacterium]|nr:MAG: hypothetical protein CYG61_02700 [Actinomycetota bacterium]